MNREILKLALPAIITNISVPLLGLVDTFIVGHLSVVYLGAIGTGSALISMLYWNFGFIRMSTSGITAQAYGKKESAEMANVLTRALLFSFIAVTFILSIKEPFCEFVFKFMETPEEIREYAKEYFSICIWGVIPILSLYALKGWLIGMQNTLYPMIISILMNGINILLSCLFVFHLNMEIEGVAYGTLFSQYIALIIGIGLWLYKYNHLIPLICWKKSIEIGKMLRLLKINGAIFIRSLCLVAVTTFIPFAGAKEGAIILAGNTLLMQLFTLFSYFSDGFAYAGEALVGKFIGGEKKTEMGNAVRHLFIWGLGIAIFFALSYAVGTKNILSILTNQTEVIQEIAPYIIWVVAIPIVSFAAFLWDGIMIGATQIRPMLYGTASAAILFFTLYTNLVDYWHNHAIWLAFVCYLATRSIIQTTWWLFHSNNIIKGNRQ